MKKQLLFLVAFAWVCSSVFAQDTIVAWTFPEASADSLVDGGLTLNSSRYLSAQYGTWDTPSYYDIVIDYTTNGSLGSPDKCAKTTGWNNTIDSAYYMVKFKTTGYGNLKLYSKQQAGGSNPGPRDFKAQYKLSGTTTWIDIPNGTIVCANDWTTGVLNGIDLPADCDNQSSSVSVRWIITSDLDINGNALASTGISKIDDIIVTGTALSGVEETNVNLSFDLYPNPNNSSKLFIESFENISSVEIYNVQGQLVKSVTVEGNKTTIDLLSMEHGIYIVRPLFNEGLSPQPQKLVIE